MWLANILPWLGPAALAILEAECVAKLYNSAGVPMQFMLHLHIA